MASLGSVEERQRRKCFAATRYRRPVDTPLKLSRKRRTMRALSCLVGVTESHRLDYQGTPGSQAL
jgi:hypothetical protein